MVPQRPFLIGSPGWVRSSAWIWLFSSTQSTIDCCGGFRYRPTTSVIFSRNFGSRESLKVSVRCGCRLWARQIGCGSHAGQIAMNVLKTDCQELDLNGRRCDAQDGD